MLPQGVTVFERGWLSANNILLQGDGPTALIDSGYWTHADQTLALVKQALAGQTLDLLINTHLHSDHCGGNAAMQREFPGMQTWIPPGHAEEVKRWDPVALTYTPTGQACPRFGMDATLQPGGTHNLGGLLWEVHAAPGHDPHSVILFCPKYRIVISADALWENGFGVVFPELEGDDAFGEVSATLDLLAALKPQVVIPGHGPVFIDAESAIAVARKRLLGFQRDPLKHYRYAAKVLIKFKLLEFQRMALPEFLAWAGGVSYLIQMHARLSPDQSYGDWVAQLLAELSASGAAEQVGEMIINK